MISIDVTPCKGALLQLWAQDAPNRPVLLPLDTDTFQRDRHRRATSSVFMRVAVAGAIRGYINLPFPSINEEDGKLNRHDTAFGLRLWGPNNELLEHASISWAMLDDTPRLPLINLRVLLVEGVGTQTSSLSQPHTTRAKWMNAKLPPLCTPKTKLLVLPNTHINLSIEAALAFRGAPVCTEEWIKARAGQAIRVICGSSSPKSPDTEQLGKILSFMLLRTTAPPDKAPDRHLRTIDTFLWAPNTDYERVCAAHHIAMSLLFTAWKAPALRALRDRIALEIGLPYVAAKNDRLWNLFVPFSQLKTLLGIQELPTKASLFDAELLVSHQALPTPIPFFASEGTAPAGATSALPFRGRDPLPEGAPDFIVGDAHERLEGGPRGDSKIFAKGAPAPSLRDKEDELVAMFAAAPAPLNAPNSQAGHNQRAEYAAAWTGTEAEAAALAEELESHDLHAWTEPSWGGPLLLVAKKRSLFNWL